jgi:hypothetical protein
MQKGIKNFIHKWYDTLFFTSNIINIMTFINHFCASNHVLFQATFIVKIISMAMLWCVTCLIFCLIHYIRTFFQYLKKNHINRNVFNKWIHVSIKRRMTWNIITSWHLMNKIEITILFKSSKQHDSHLLSSWRMKLM